MPAPKKFDLSKGTLTPISSTAPKKFDLSKGTIRPIDSPSSDYSGGSSNTEGQYVMIGKDKKAKPVAYSRVNDAYKDGYRMDPSSAITYVKNASADPNLKNLFPEMGAIKAVGRNSAGQIMISPTDNKPEGSAISRFASSFGSAISSAASGMYHSVVDKPQTEEEKKIFYGTPESPKEDYGALIMYRMLVHPAIDQGKQAVSEFKQTNPRHWGTSLTPVEQEHRTKALGHGIAAAIPMVGPWAAQTGEKIGEQAGKGNYAGAAGTLAGNVALYEAPKVIGKGVNIVSKVPRATLEAVTETGPRGIKEEAERVYKANQEAIDKANKDNTTAAQEHLEKTEDALHKTKGSELETEEKNKTAKEKEKSDHDAEVAKVNKHNQRVIDKHKAVSERIQQENDAADHAADLRRAEESKLEKDTQDHYDKIDATKAKVKTDADAKWNPVHQSLDAKTIDGGDIQKPLAKILEISPDVRREISQLIPDPEDVDQTSPYVKKRTEVLAARGHKNPQAAYDSMDDFNKRLIDSIVEREGFTPDPIDLDPKSGVGITFDKIHRAQSIIGRNIRNGRYGYEGPLRGEMSQLQKVLYNAESKIASDNGMSADLDDARQATREYQESFGRQRNIPKNGDDALKQRENPEKFKKDNEQELLDAASKHDPSLATEYEKIKEQREKVKKMQTEDQLRKSKKQIPPPPTVDDLREGYRLKPKPIPKPPKTELSERTAPPDRPLDVKEAMDNYDKMNPSSTPIARQKYMDSISGNPKEVKAETKNITTESEKARELGNIKKTAKELRSMGLRRAIYASLTSVPFAVIEFFNHKGETGAGRALSGGVLAGGVVLGGSHLLANLIERPDVAAWISKITPEKAAEWNKLPPEQKSLFAEDMKTLLEEADKKKKPVSPALRMFVTGITVSQKAQEPKTTQELVDEWNKSHPDKQVTLPQPSTSPSSTEAPQTMGGQPSVQGPQSSTKPLTRQDVLAKAAELQEQFRNAGMAS
jgi:hypothetical protein